MYYVLMHSTQHDALLAEYSVRWLMGGISRSLANKENADFFMKE